MSYIDKFFNKDSLDISNVRTDVKQPAATLHNDVNPNTGTNTDSHVEEYDGGSRRRKRHSRRRRVTNKKSRKNRKSRKSRRHHRRR